MRWLCALGRQIERHAFFGSAAVMVALGILEWGKPDSTWLFTIAMMYLLVWSVDMRAERWRARADEWKVLATTLRAEIERRNTADIQWPEFTQAVRDNLPEEQGEAVQYALELALASLIHRDAH